MLEYFLSNLGTIIIGFIVAAVTVIAVICMIRNKKRGKSSCGCGCTDCPMHGNCHRSS